MSSSHSSPLRVLFLGGRVLCRSVWNCVVEVALSCQSYFPSQVLETQECVIIFSLSHLYACGNKSISVEERGIALYRESLRVRGEEERGGGRELGVGKREKNGKHQRHNKIFKVTPIVRSSFQSPFPSNSFYMISRAD